MGVGIELLHAEVGRLGFVRLCRMGAGRLGCLTRSACVEQVVELLFLDAFPTSSSNHFGAHPLDLGASGMPIQGKYPI